MAAEGYRQNKQVEGMDDIEFWLHNLVNKFCGYVAKNGFQDEWDKSCRSAQFLNAAADCIGTSKSSWHHVKPIKQG